MTQDRRGNLTMSRAARRTLLALVILVFGSAGVSAGYALTQHDAPASLFGGPAPPPGLEAALGELSTDGECFAAKDAEFAVRSRLDELGLEDWTVVLGTGAHEDACVSFSLDTAGRRVALIWALSPKVREGLEQLRDDLLNECLSRDEAADRVRAILRKAGEVEWELRMGGRVNAPSDRIEEARAHIAAGCWIYSGTGWTADGTRLFWIGGNE